MFYIYIYIYVPYTIPGALTLLRLKPANCSIY